MDTPTTLMVLTCIALIPTAALAGGLQHIGRAVTMFGVDTDKFKGAPTIGFNADARQRLHTIKNGMGRYCVHLREEGTALYFEGTCTEEQS